MYKAACVAIALRAQGVPFDEIAAGLDLSVNSVKQYLKIGRKKQWFKGDALLDPEDQLEICLKSDAVQNIAKVLIEKDEIVHVDKTTGLRSVTVLDRPSNRAVLMTLEVAKGTGMLKQHQVVKNDGAQSIGVALKVSVEMPPNAAAPMIRQGSIGGQPAFDAEIVE